MQTTSFSTFQQKLCRYLMTSGDKVHRQSLSLKSCKFVIVFAPARTRSGTKSDGVEFNNPCNYNILFSGLIWSEIKQLWDVGLEEYVRDMWNVIDFITNSLYVATVALRIVSIYQVRSGLSVSR